MSRLIVVSNRVNPPVDAGMGAVGGLAMALAAALREYSGVWFGWSGETTPSFSGQISMQKVGGVTVALMDLEEQDREEYYDGYANRTLWPLFHSRTDLAAYERSFDAGYERVNQRFAQTLAPLIGPGDVVWIHDYHLIPLGQALRRLGVTNRIGFFLHIPWPGPRTFTTLPEHRRLAESLLAYDLVGFQSQDSLIAFDDYVERELGLAMEDGAVAFEGRKVKVGVFPIGIEAAAFADLAGGEIAQATFERMRQSQAGRWMVIGVDRLDYSKGLEERFVAYEQMLADHPDLAERVFLLQIATPSRDAVQAYQEIRARLDAISGRINGAYATVDWVPIRYVNRAHRRDELAGLYRAAHVGLVTPLRDGMNLVAKEYVAAQDPLDPGVLVLSRYAGAAEQMDEALIVNPFSREEMSEALAQALAMPLAERRRRWRSLMDGVLADDVSAWRDRFVAALRGPVDRDLASDSRLLTAEEGDNRKTS
ncbi:alpha,alpha-trehalose-phosphate synthase (UDP-forming) [Caulobacter flavus]|jgi:trehalose 6-phosphate synthase|uniref:Trehalose-6-phosphate synthase n=1 Tax=Caulobacter flavus TaxID=1679497 RepID=A0A2N5CPN5_9CAUL|nr:alpha,alpha-trehalose-phosphate synthase (UDP-forming) [Caulobacter flavus]PLR09125.1 alpha,alpha-trehalose-phosphate synthase (UDP-forming) [Caulobacter flavus]